MGDSPCSVAAADFNGDGVSDVAIPNESSVVILLGQRDGGFVPGHDVTTESHATLTTGDFNGDGVVDLAAAHASADEISVLMGVSLFFELYRHSLKNNTLKAARPLKRRGNRFGSKVDVIELARCRSHF